MKIALIYDRVNKYGGAERVLEALHEIWPEAPLYTAVYNEKSAAWADKFDVKSSFLQHFPLARSQHELYPWLIQMAFETFNFRDFEVVISVSSEAAKAVITRPATLHINYCLTPTRYLWSGYETYLKHPGFGLADRLVSEVLRRSAGRLRAWDLVAASRPDEYVAISHRVAARIAEYYGRQATKVIYPPVSVRYLSQLSTQTPGDLPQSYYLTVSRLVGYKRLDLLITVFNQLGKNLVIIGRGKLESQLRRQARQNITFITDYLTDSELVGYHRKARGFVYAADEDFGISAVEAQALGLPVVAFASSGLSEIVKEAKTGFLFAQQSKDSLIAAIGKLESSQIRPEDCRAAALRFDTSRFQQEFADFVRIRWSEHQKIL